MVIVVVKATCGCIAGGDKHRNYLPLSRIIDGRKVDYGVVSVVGYIEVFSQLCGDISVSIAVKPDDFIARILIVFKLCLGVKIGCSDSQTFAEEVTGFVKLIILALDYGKVYRRIVYRQPACDMLVFYVQVAESLKVVRRKIRGGVGYGRNCVLLDVDRCLIDTEQFIEEGFCTV